MIRTNVARRLPGRVALRYLTARLFSECGQKSIVECAATDIRDARLEP